MKRVTIVGPSGSGKSTLAQELGELYGLTVFHMDQLFFRPGWIEKSRTELIDEVEHILQTNDEWIIEGNYSQTLPSRIANSTHVIFLDYPRHIYVYRVLKRLMMTYGRVRKDMSPGCPERLDLAFLKYVWQFKSKRRDKLISFVESEVTEKNKLIIFKHPKGSTAYLEKLKDKQGVEQ